MIFYCKNYQRQVIWVHYSGLTYYRAPRKIQALLRMATRFKGLWALKIRNRAINRGAL